MKVPEVDKEKCTGCGTCVALCPEVFELGEDGIARVKNLDSYEDYPVQDAIDSCPNQAIDWQN